MSYFGARKADFCGDRSAKNRAVEISSGTRQQNGAAPVSRMTMVFAGTGEKVAAPISIADVEDRRSRS